MIDTSATETTVIDEVTEHVRGLIATRGLKRGEAIPSYREIAKDVGVAYASVKLAMDVLVEQGVVRRKRARGCYVNKELSPAGKPLKTLGIIYPASRSYLFGMSYLIQIMQGLSSVHTSSLDMMIFSLRDDGMVSAAQIANRGVDGVLLLGVESDDYLREFTTWGVPGVVVDHYADNIPLDFVACDNASAVDRAVRHLVERGHRRIQYVQGEATWTAQFGGAGQPAMLASSSDVIERQESARNALSKASLDKWDIATLSHFKDGLAGFVGRWQDDAERATAFLAYDDTMALNLIGALAERGVRVPADVSVCAVAGAGEATFRGLGVTQCRFDFTGMGMTAVTILLERCLNPGKGNVSTHRVGFDFIEGETTSAVGAA